MNFRLSEFIGVFFFFYLCFWPSIAISYDFPERPYRDYFGKQGLTATDERELAFLDTVITTKSATPESISEFVRILKSSDSKDVVCHALAVLSIIPTLPEYLIDELVFLSNAKDPFLKDQLALLLGKLTIPRTFQAILNLLQKPNPSIRALAVLPRFGFMTFANPHNISLIRFKDDHFENLTSIYIINYYLDFIEKCLKLSSVRMGIHFPVSLGRIPIDFYPSFSPIPVLPRIKKIIKSLQELPPIQK